jgi:hypothetical protein
MGRVKLPFIRPDTTASRTPTASMLISYSFKQLRQFRKWGRVAERVHGHGSLLVYPSGEMSSPGAPDRVELTVISHVTAFPELQLAAPPVQC